MTRPPLDELRALAEKATKGPLLTGCTNSLVMPHFACVDAVHKPIIAQFDTYDDCKLFVAAVNALPALLSYIAELERDAERYRWLRANWTTMSSIATRSALKFELGVKPWADFSGDVIDAAIDSAREGDNA